MVITTPHTPTEITLTHEMMCKKVGKEVTEKEATDILSRLGFSVTSKK